METFDITVIGSGPGGYVAAIRTAQLGYNTEIRLATIGDYPRIMEIWEISKCFLFTMNTVVKVMERAYFNLWMRQKAL